MSNDCFSGLDKNRSLAEDKNCAGSPAAIPSRSCRSKSNYFFPQLLPGPGRNRLCSRTLPLLYSRCPRSRPQEPAQDVGCCKEQQQLQLEVAARAASQRLPLLGPRPPWPPVCPCERAAHSDGGRSISAPAQRVAFIFSLCAVLTEGRDEEKGETASRASQSAAAAAAETSFADSGGKRKHECLGKPANNRSTAQPARRRSRRPAFP